MARTNLVKLHTLRTRVGLPSQIKGEEAGNQCTVEMPTYVRSWK